MNPLNLHILYLAERHDCVIVPGFGAFIIERIPSHINSETLTVYPPERRIGFNSELTDDDGLLIHSIARRSRINHQEARRIVEHTVESFRERLAEGAEVTIDGIGSFTLSEEGRKLFSPVKPEQSEKYSLPLLSTNSIPEINMPVDGNQPMTQDYGDTETLSRDGVDSELTEGVTVETTATENCNRKGHFNTSRNYYLPINKFIARVACSLVILIGLIVVFTLPETRTVTEVQKASVVPVESLMNLKKEVKTEKPTIKEVTDTDKKVSESKNDISPAEILSYHLIVATFHSQEEAEHFIARAEDDSTALTPIKGKGGTWRVAAASSADRAVLQAKLNRLNERFEGAWIWERR